MIALFPRLHTDWLNGWPLLVIHGVVFGGIVRSFPKDVVARLYDKSHWTRTQRALTTVGKVLSGILFALLTFSPLQIGHSVFVIGSVLFILSLISLVVALSNFRNAAPNRPATNGLYRLSRNSQVPMLVVMFVGIGRAFLVTVLPEIPDQARALAELRRVLREGGHHAFLLFPQTYTTTLLHFLDTALGRDRG